MVWKTVASLALLIQVSCAYNNGIGRLPVMGWNTWCTDGKPLLTVLGLWE
jgi:hypothetical protein